MKIKIPKEIDLECFTCSLPIFDFEEFITFSVGDEVQFFCDCDCFLTWMESYYGILEDMDDEE